MLAVQGPRGARDRRRSSSTASCRRACAAGDARARRRRGAGLRHRLHRRGRGRGADRRPPRRRRRSGTRCSAPARPRRASALATRCGSRSAFTSTATTSRSSATRSRPASAGAARRRPGFIGAEAVAARPRRRDRREAGAVRAHRARDPAPGQPGASPPARSPARSPAAPSRPRLERGIGMAYVRAELAEPGTEIEIDVRGRRRAARVESRPCTTPTTHQGG